MTDALLTAGPEMDKAISEITGIPLLECDEGDWFEFHPSEDWNDAMAAAEKFGLFVEDSGRVLLQRGPTGVNCAWAISHDYLNHRTAGTLVAATTGPLAICRAIIAISSRNDT